MASREDRKKQITSQRREQILSAALLVFSQFGYDRATIPDIAREAGIAVGTIYNYYPSKRELLVAITGKYINEPFTNFINQPHAVDDTACIATFLENRLDFVLDNADIYMPLLNEVQHDPELRREFAERVLGPLMEMMEQYVALKVKSGSFRDVNPSLTTRAIGGIIIGFMHLYRIEGEKSPAHNIDRKKLATGLAELILRGVKKT